MADADDPLVQQLHVAHSEAANFAEAHARAVRSCDSTRLLSGRSLPEKHQSGRCRPELVHGTAGRAPVAAVTGELCWRRSGKETDFRSSLYLGNLVAQVFLSGGAR